MVMPTKSVGWSYRSSSNAERFGFRDGCWTVSLRRGTGVPEAVKGFAKKEDAIIHAQGMRQEGRIIPWDPIFLQFNRDLAFVHESTD